MPLAAHERPLPAFHRCVRWSIGALARTLWGFRIEGLEHIPREGPLIVAANHASLADGPLLFYAVSAVRPVSFLSKEELFRNRFSSWFFTRGWAIPIDRRGDVSAMRQALSVLEKGGCLGLFPQGTRAKAGVPPRLKPGLGFLAAQSRAKVVPARVVNTDRFPWGRPVEIRFGPGLEFAGDAGSREQCLEFVGQVMARVSAL